MTDDSKINNATTLSDFIKAVNDFFKETLIPITFPVDTPLASFWGQTISVVKGTIKRIIGGKEETLTTYSVHSSEIDTFPLNFGKDLKDVSLKFKLRLQVIKPPDSTDSS